MRTYLEYRDDKSEKFWEITVKETTVTRRWGKVGTKGQTKSEDHPNAHTARTASQKLIDEKLGKGYVLGHSDRSTNERLARARAIRTSLVGAANFGSELTQPFPPKPDTVSWKDYWDLYLEAREIERPVAEFLKKPQLWDTEDRRWEWSPKDRPKMDATFAGCVRRMQVPDDARALLTQLDKIKSTGGILTVDRPLDLATMFLVLSHRNADDIKEIRHRDWSEVDLELLKENRSSSLKQFKKLFHIDVPDFILELNHYIKSMWEVGCFHMCIAAGFQETSYGIFDSVMQGKNPMLADLGGWERFEFHDLNYFAIAQSERVTRGIVFDYNDNAFAPYFFYCDLEPSPVGSVWDCLLDSMDVDEYPCFSFEDFGSMEELEFLLDDDLASYDLAAWFFKLATIGYLNLYDKPSLYAWGVDEIKFGNQIGLNTDSYIKGKKASDLLSAALSTNQFLPAYPIRIGQNFHPAFSDASLSALFWACRDFDYGIKDFLKEGRSEDSKLLVTMGFDSKIPLHKRSKKSENYFYETVGEFCKHEADAGRPHLAFLAGLSIWNGSSEKWRKLSAELLKKVPDEICHPFLKKVAEVNA